MSAFKNGVAVNSHPCGEGEYRRLRISAGPQRQMYVDIAVLEAKLGRKLLPGMTVEHINGDSLDLIGDGSIPGDNLMEVTQSENSKLMWQRITKGKIKNGK
jgi:hypothetical protein